MADRFLDPSTRLPNLQPTGSIPSLQVNAPAAAFGPDGRTLQQAGDALQKTSDNLDKVWQRQQALQNEAAAKDADAQMGNEVRGLLFDPDKGYLATSRGKGAIDGAKPTLDALVQIQKKYQDQLGNTPAGRAFQPVANSRIAEAQDQVARHLIVETRTYNDNASAARVQGAVDGAGANFDDNDAVNKNLATIRTELTQQGQTNREAPEVTEEKIRQQQSQAVGGVVRKWADIDPYKAKQLLDANRTSLTNQESTTLDHIVRQAVVNRGATDTADAIRRGDSALGSLDNNIGNISKSGLQYSGGKGAPQGAFETFATPEQGAAAAYQTIIAKAKQNGGTISFNDLIAGNKAVQGWAARDNGRDPLLRGNNPEAYASRLAKSIGLKPTDAVPIGDDTQMAKILQTMNQHEKGKQTVPDGAFAAGISLVKGNGPRSEATSANKPEIDPSTGQPTLQWQLAQADKIQDPELREATQGRLRTLHGQDDAARTEQQRMVADDVMGMVLNQKLTDPAQVPAEKWAALDPLHQRTFQALMDANARKVDRAPNPALYAELSHQMTDDPDGFKKRDLVPLAGQLPNDDWKHFQNMQTAMGSRENAMQDKLNSVQRGLQVSDSLIKSAAVYMGYTDSKGKVTNEKSYADFKAQYQTALLKEIEGYTTANNKRPSDDELNKMADRLLMQGRFSNTGFINDDRGVFFQQQPGDAAPRFYVRYSDIPSDRRKVMEDTLRSRNLPADKQSVERAYTAWRAAGNH